MTQPIRHVVASASAAGSFKKAITLAEKTDEVIFIWDSYNLGPIDNADLSERERWIDKELDIWGFEHVIKNSDRFWTKVLSGDNHLVLWVSRHSAIEYCGFLECIWRLGTKACSVLDITDLSIRCQPTYGKPGQTYLASAVSLLTPNAILENDLFESNKAQSLTQENRNHYRTIWQQLRAANAPFRIVNEKGIVSAHITYFDEEICSFVTKEWQKSAHIIGNAIRKQYRGKYIQSGDLVLFSRLRKLVELGVLESQGDLSQIHQSEVRLKSAA